MTTYSILYSYHNNFSVSQDPLFGLLGSYLELKKTKKQVRTIFTNFPFVP